MNDYIDLEMLDQDRISIEEIEQALKVAQLEDNQQEIVRLIGIMANGGFEEPEPVFADYEEKQEEVTDDVYMDDVYIDIGEVLDALQDYNEVRTKENRLIVIRLLKGEE